MTSPRDSQITDELLSAYIDGAVTEEERTLVEAAVAAEPTVAWRLETLRQTVQLLRSLPVMALPRSFALNELAVTLGQERTAAKSTPAARPRQTASAPVGRLAVLREALRGFWQMGSPLLRNAAAVSFALFLVLLVGDFAVTGAPPQPGNVANRQTGSPALITATAPAKPVAMAKATAMATVMPTSTAVPTLQRKQSDERTLQSPSPRPEATVAPSAAGGAVHIESAGSEIARDSGEENGAGGRPPGPDPSVELDPNQSSADEAAPSMFTSPFRESTTAPNQDSITAASVATNASTIKTETQSVTESITGTGILTLALPASEEAGGGQREASTASPTATIVASSEPAQVEATAGAALSPTAAATSEADTTIAATPAANATSSIQPAQPTVVGRSGTAVPLGARSTLMLLQTIAGVFTLLFLALWWRSRSQPAQS